MSLNSVVVICTRNRPDEIAFLVNYLDKTFGNLELLVVDASDDHSLVIECASAYPHVKVIHSTKGLPLQRNIAIRYVRQHLPKGTVLHFIDDDVIPNVSYFSAIEKALRSQGGNPTMLASWDQLLGLSTLTKMLIFLRLKGRAGHLGAALLPTPPSPNEESPVWAAGHGLSLVPSQCKNFEFNEDIEFFGEDLDATLRFTSKFGRIICIDGASLLHIPAKRQGDRVTYDRQESEIRRRTALTNFGPSRRLFLALAFTVEGAVLALLSGLAISGTYANMARNRFSQLRGLFDR
jgi:glycosyltransferase involved in cell wall biosynthesis